MKCPALVMACGFALGIWLARPAPVFLLLGACAAALLASAIALRAGKLRAVAALAFIGFVCAGSASAVLFKYRFPSNHVSHLADWGLTLEHPVLLQGRLKSSPLRMPYGIQFDLEVKSISDGTITRATSGKVRLRVMNGRHSPLPAAALQLHYGQWISIRARLRRPQNNLNPGAFDYRRWIESTQDIYWQGIAERPEAVEKIAGPPPPLASRLIAGAREHLLASIDRMYPPWSIHGRDGAVLKAVLLGDRSSLDSATIEGFRKSGLYHLLVVAGLHVGLLALLAEGLLRLLRLRERWRTALLLLFLATYALLVEQRAPTLRASLMIGFYLLARLFDRSQPALNAIGIAALALLVYRPAWLFESGFQLSFAAALLIAGLAVPLLERLTEPYRRGLTGLGEPARDLAFEPRVAQFRLDARAFARWLGGRNKRSSREEERAVAVVSGVLRVLIWFADLLIFSAILQLGLLLPMTEIFHRVTLAGIGLNALAVPLMTILLAVAAPVVILNLAWPALAALPAKLLVLIMEALFKLTEFAHMPHWLSFRVPGPPGWAAWGFALTVIAAAFGLHYGRRLFATASIFATAFVLLVVVHPFPAAIPTSGMHLTALDCEGGEGILLTLPDGVTVLVGAGGGGRSRLGGGDPFRARRWDPGENVMSPFLWSRGIRKIDVLLLPDASGDYLNGVEAVLGNFRVKQVWFGRPPPEPYADAFRALLRQHGVAGRRLHAGDVIERGRTQFAVLWQDVDPPSGRRRPSPAMLMRISNRDGSILLAADLSHADQDRVLAANLLMHSTVLEARSSEMNSHFISSVEPAVIIENSGWMSVGKNEDPRTPARTGGVILSALRNGAVTVAMHDGAVSVLATK